LEIENWKLFGIWKLIRLGGWNLELSLFTNKSQYINLKSQIILNNQKSIIKKIQTYIEIWKLRIGNCLEFGNSVLEFRIVTIHYSRINHNI